jgi:hypothetical protein
MKSKGISSVIGLLLAAVLVVLTACGDTSVTTDKCAITVGSGGSHGAKINDVYYPGQTFYQDDGEDVKHFPCNPRTFIVNNGHVTNANGEKVGDRFNLSVGYTKDHTKVLIASTTYWTLNQKKSVLKNDFAPVCLKFNCWSSNSDSGNANYSTRGWNGMLGETISTGLDNDVLQQTQKYGDEIWQQHDTALWKELSDDLSASFKTAVRPTTGAADDLFCGSGNSKWTNPNEPGKGEFTCSNVRVIVTGVEPADQDVEKQASAVNAKDAKKRINEDQLEIAKAKYGSLANYVLAMQDILASCPKGSTCYLPQSGYNPAQGQ